MPFGAIARYRRPQAHPRRASDEAATPSARSGASTRWTLDLRACPYATAIGEPYPVAGTRTKANRCDKRGEGE